MPLIDVPVSNLINGVSQQADSLRFPSQCDEQVNALCSVIDGLAKRPPTQHIKKLFTTLSESFYHTINRDTTERYEVVVTGGTSPVVNVFDLSGTAYPVKNEAGGTLSVAEAAYLATSTPSTSLRALTVADYTVFLNRDKTVAMKSDLVPATNPAALLFLKTFRQGLELSVTLTGFSKITFKVSAEVITTTGDVNKGKYTFTNDYNATLGYGLDQGALMAYVSSILQVRVGTGYTLTQADGVIHVTRSTDFTAVITCTSAESLYCFKESVQNFSMLPKKGYAGFQVQVKGDPEESGDDYYAEFQPSTAGATGFAEGYWEESQKPGITYKLDPATLPHALVSYGTYFVFKPLVWGAREAGDEATNPKPSFVGQTIRNLFFWKNRLGFLSGENVLMSEASEFFNFWRTTVITLLDSDPIDVGVAHTRASLLNAAVPNSEKLVLVSDQTQFTLQGGDLLTPKTVSITPTTEYENLKDVEPLSLGNSIFMVFPRGQYAGLLEYAVESDTALFAGFDTSSHIPRYLAGPLTKLVGSENEGTLIALSSSLPTGCYIYRYYVRGGQKLMSAWSKFDFGTGTIVRDVFLIGTKVYFVITRADGTHLESMDISAGLRDDDAQYAILLDRRIPDTALVSRTYDAFANTTTLVLPYTPTENVEVVTRETPSAKGGFRLRVFSVLGTSVIVRGDHTSTPLWLGQPYTMRYVMTKPTLRRSDGQSNLVVSSGRFQVRRGLLAFNDTLFFKVQVTPLYRETYYYTYENRNLNVGNVIIDQPTLQKDGTFSFPVLSKSDQVTIELLNDSPYPSSFLSVDWEAFYQARSTRQ